MPGFALRATRRTTLLFAFLVPLPVALPGVPSTAIQVAGLLLALVFLAECVVRGRVPQPPRGVAGTILSLVLLGCAATALASVASAAVAVDPGAALSVGLRYALGLVVTYAVATSLVDFDAVRRAAGALVAGAAAAVLIALLGYAWPPVGDLTIGVSRRAAGFFDHPNQLGMILSAVALICAAHVLARPRSVRAWACLGALGYGVLLTGSLANTLLLVAGVVLLLLPLPSGRIVLSRVVVRSILVLVGVVAVAAAGPVVLEAISPRVAAMVQGLVAGDGVQRALPSVQERLGLYRAAFEGVAAHPVLGIGADNVVHYLSDSGGRPMFHAHNVLLNVALGTGLVGFVAFLPLVAAWLLASVRLLLVPVTSSAGSAPMARGIGAALLVFFLSNQSSDSLGGTIVYLAWLLLGLAVALLATRPPERKNLT